MKASSLLLAIWQNIARGLHAWPYGNIYADHSYSIFKVSKSYLKFRFINQWECETCFSYTGPDFANFDNYSIHLNLLRNIWQAKIISCENNKERTFAWHLLWRT